MIEVKDLLDIEQSIIYKNKWQKIQEITAEYIVLNNCAIVSIDNLWINESNQLEVL